jgi:hypothetical protein
MLEVRLDSSRPILDEIPVTGSDREIADRWFEKAPQTLEVPRHVAIWGCDDDRRARHHVVTGEQERGTPFVDTDGVSRREEAAVVRGVSRRVQDLERKAVDDKSFTVS